MLSDALNEMRELFRTARPEQKEAVREVLPGFDTNIALYATAARDLEIQHAAMADAIRPQKGDADVPVFANSRQRLAARMAFGPPGIARRYGQTG